MEVYGLYETVFTIVSLCSHIYVNGPAHLTHVDVYHLFIHLLAPTTDKRQVQEACLKKIL
jgi:hypothetical protein